MSTLQEFLGVGANSRCRLVLPHFRGPAVLASDSCDPPLAYRGPVFAERDTRAAFYVRTLLQDVVDPNHIDVEAADAGELPLGGPAFLFGSRSNAATIELLKQQPWPLVAFEFGAEWTIHC